MAQNFIQCDREQLVLMAPSLREWLPENHLARRKQPERGGHGHGTCPLDRRSPRVLADPATRPGPPVRVHFSESLIPV